MPTLKHLVEDVEKLGANPEDIHIPGVVFDDLVEQADEQEE
ncbi:MAG TPA: hypothetical protein VMX96_03965 [Dehalococcoidia bacterium]|nr:hypothetical protein [Dehalococcoidia bacterium]